MSKIKEDTTGRLSLGQRDRFAVWSPTGTQPSIGNDTLNARYLTNGRLCTGSVGLYFGSSTGRGSGDWSFSLPVPAGGSGMRMQYSGTAHIRNAGIENYRDVFWLFPKRICILYYFLRVGMMEQTKIH